MSEVEGESWGVPEGVLGIGGVKGIGGGVRGKGGGVRGIGGG